MNKKWLKLSTNFNQHRLCESSESLPKHSDPAHVSQPAHSQRSGYSVQAAAPSAGSSTDDSPAATDHTSENQSNYE